MTNPYLDLIDEKEEERNPYLDLADEDERSGLNNLARGVMQGLGTAGTSTVGAIGTLTGSEGLQNWARRSEEEMRGFYDPQGTAGNIGRGVGRVAGELGAGIVGGGLGVKAATKASPALARALAGAGRLKRGAATALANAPIDIVQGAKEEEGLVLPGRLGSIVESVGLTGAAGALLPAARSAKAASVADDVPPPATGFPERTTELSETVTDPARYANLGRMTSKEPELVGGLGETVAGAVTQRQLGERLPARGKEILGRLVETETHEELIKRVADLYGGKPSDIVARTAKGERVGREAVLRATEELLEHQSNINGINARLRSGLAVDPQEVARLEALRDVERSAAYDLFASISTQKTDMARDLAATRIGTALDNTAEAWKDRLEELAKRGLTGDEIARAEAFAETGDIDGLMQMGREIRKSTFGEKVVTAFRASLLTGPKTFMANFTGNAGMAALRQIRDIPATFADMAMASMTGQRSKVLDFKARWNSVSAGARKGLEDAKAVMAGKSPASQKFSEIREVNYDNAFANLYTKGVFRTLDATDRVFRSMAFSESIAEQARVIARNHNLTGDAAVEFVERMTKAPTTEMVADAALAADVATFQQTTAATRAALKIRDSFGLLGYVLFPFAKTPTNIATTIVHHSPLGLAGKQFRTNLKRVLAREATVAQQRMVAERVGDFSVGTGLMLLGYLKGKKGEMTGFYPPDERTRAQWEAEGKQEGAIKANGNWVQVNRISPVGNLLTIGASLADVERGSSGVLAMAIGSLSAPLSAVVDLPMVQGLSNIVDIANPQATPAQKEDAASRVVGGTLSGAVPFSGLLRSTAQAMDPMVREARTDGRMATVLNRVQAGIPFASERLPERVDALGKPIERGGTALERFASPLQRKQDLTTTDPVRAALHKANVVVGRLSRRKGEGMQEYHDRATAIGSTVESVVGRVAESEPYQRIDTMSVDRIRRGLEAADIDVSGRSDDDLRNAYRSLMLERAISRAKSAAGRAYRPTTSPTATRLQRALDRQP